MVQLILRFVQTAAELQGIVIKIKEGEGLLLSRFQFI